MNVIVSTWKHVLNPSPRFDKIAVNAHRASRSRIHKLSIVQMCHVCNESYVGMKVFQRSDRPKCALCKYERGAHRFSVWNNMDPKEHPYVLVLHAPGGQYKYSGHTISFPQDIHSVTSSLSRHVKSLDVLIVRKRGEDGRNYDCYVKGSRVMNVLSYKVRFDRYYARVVVDEDAIQLLPKRATDVSNRLSTVVLEMNDPMRQIDVDANIDGNQDVHGLHHPTSFTSRRPNTLHEMEPIRVWLQNAQGPARDIVDWSNLGVSPINEYNTEELRTQLETLPDVDLVEKVIKFRTTLRGTRAYWSKCLRELSNMIHQIGCPTIFFTLSAANMQWLDLHQLMLKTPPCDAAAVRKWHCNNGIQHPHIVAKYMHLRHTIFREEVLTKFHGATEFWSRYGWQHRGSPHVHGFLWLRGALDMDRLDWENTRAVQHTKSFFSKIVHAWNPRDAHHRKI
eukprot:Gb_29816 [translate_table: standard]